MNHFSRPASKANQERISDLRHRSLYALFLRSSFISKPKQTSKPEQIHLNCSSEYPNSLRLQSAERREVRSFLANIPSYTIL